MSKEPENNVRTTETYVRTAKKEVRNCQKTMPELRTAKSNVKTFLSVVKIHEKWKNDSKIHENDVKSTSSEVISKLPGSYI